MRSVNAAPPSLNAATTAYEADLWPVNKAVVLAVTFILMLAGWSITDSYIGYLARLTAINVIVAYSLNLLIGYAGQAFIAIGATFAIGAYASALGMMKLGAPFLVAWPAGGIVAGIFGLLSSLPAMRLAGAYLAMVSIAFNVVVEQILIHWTELTGGPIGLPAIPAASIGGFELDDRAMLVLIIFVATLTVYGCTALRQSQWGRALAAMGENELASKSLGIRTLRLKAAVFWLSSVIAGLAGGLYAHSMRYISPDIGTIFASFNFIIMLVLGGIRSKWGPLVGAVLLTLGPQLLSNFERYHLLVLGIILLAVVTTMPQGVAQIVESLVARFGRSLDRQESAIPQPLPAALSFAQFGESIAPVGNHELIADAIDRSFGGVAALQGASITVRSGMIRGLIGPNGSGKSTLVNVISGIDRANAGEIQFDGDQIGGLTCPTIANAGVIRSFQTPRIFCELTVMENLLAAQFRRHASSLFAAFFDLPSSRRVTRDAAEQAGRVAQALGMEGLLGQRAGSLSQGDKRKLEIARALAAEPSVLILDEPAAGLSTEEAATLCALLEPLKAKGLGVILVEHHMDVIMRVCDRITVLERGTVIAEGTPKEVQDDPEVRRAYLGTQRRAARESQNRWHTGNEAMTMGGQL